MELARFVARPQRGSQSFTSREAAMTQSNVSQQLTQSFDNTSPNASSTPCCREVRGRWESFRLVRGGLERDGDFEINEVPASRGNVTGGIRFTQWVRLSMTVKGKVVCICADDGRTLGSREIERTLPPVRFPLSYTLAGRIPYLGLLYVARDLQTIDNAINAASNDPAAADRLKAFAGEEFSRAYNEARNSADNICRSMNRCAGA